MSYLITDISNHIAVITINRPEALNAFNDDLIKELESALNDCIEDEDVGVIILTGAGDKAFIAGADIRKMQNMTPEQALQFGQLGQHLTRVIEDSPKPVIAAVNGFALGGGCEISLACHIRVASDNAKFGLPEVSLGLLPGWGGTQRLPRVVGNGYAHEMIVTGQMIDAERAHHIGLVNHVVPLKKLLDTAIGLAQSILKNSPNAVARAMRCIQKGRGISLEDGLNIEVNAFKRLFTSEETQEGLAAFVEKRKANYR